MSNQRPSSLESYQLCFRSLSADCGGLRFPCDAKGHIDFDHLSDRARNDYFYARVCIGRTYAAPIVESATLH